MFQFFEQLGNFLGKIVDFVVSFFNNLISFFLMLTKSLMFVVEICFALPLPLQLACLVIVCVAGVFLIIGR